MWLRKAGYTFWLILALDLVLIYLILTCNFREYVVFIVICHLDSMFLLWNFQSCLKECLNLGDPFSDIHHALWNSQLDLPPDASGEGEQGCWFGEGGYHELSKMESGLWRDCC